MKKCWDLNSKNRPNVIELCKSLQSINDLYKAEIEKAENCRISSLKEDRQVTTHSQAIYTSRLLDPYTKDLKDLFNDNSECLDLKID